MTTARPPRGRVLSADERTLWERIARTAKPLGSPRRTGGSSAADESGDEAVPSGKAKHDRPVGKPAGARPAQGSGPAAAPDRTLSAQTATGKLDRRTERGLRRGQIEVEGRLDLHGMTQAAALPALRRFLGTAQKRGWTHVLVITGKGRPGGGEFVWGEDRSERGILKRQVPLWLAAPDFRSLVVGVSPAHRRHGGEGALYVRVRKVSKPPR